MTKRMLIDATHPEETRVVVLAGNRLEEYDFETSTKKQLKGNIYLAKVTRVEPSLQAAFVEFGGNRHGFLAFSEIHPDYYQIPVADRAALLREHEEELAAEAAAEAAEDDEVAEAAAEVEVETAPPEPPEEIVHAIPADAESVAEIVAAPAIAGPEAGVPAADGETVPEVQAESAPASEAPAADDGAVEDVLHELPPPPPAEDIGGGDDADVHQDERRRIRPRRHRYKIQEVIKRRQILLVQVVKEERGTKGAALTTYLSLAGRYCVLMPNTAKGGGISRKITNAGDRKRMKSLISDLEIADGMAVILRTAAVERSKAELKRDFEFLMRAWDQVRELTLKSIAPTLVYEEANLIKRSIRDLYTKDIDEVLVDGDEGYKTAKEFMRMLMPSHAKKVQPYKDPEIPLFHRYQVEAQLDAMHSPQVQLKSGGYIVINPTEALVSIDVNSGRATRERNVEETAYKTNLEAADEIARQLRLRDLAGLIVIDFIDMAEHRNQHNVERRIKDAMRSDRARIQIGRISAFGLLELSRQRLRPSLIETSTQPCPHCHGTGLIRSTESAALHVLRAIEEEGIRRRSIELRISVPTSIALYVLNQKRAMLRAIESRYGFSVRVDADDSLIPPDYTLERVEGRPVGEAPRPEAAAAEPESTEVEEDVLSEDEAEIEAQDDSGAPSRQREGSEERGGRRRGRRGRRGRRAESGGDVAASGQTSAGDPAAAPADVASDAGEFQGEGHDGGSTDSAAQVQGTPGKRRRRGRRGGRRRGRNRDGDATHPAGPQAQAAAPGNTAAGEPRVNGDTRAGDEEGIPAPTPEPAVDARPEEINGHTGADAPAAAASQTGNGGDEPVQESPAPPEVTVEPEVAAKTDAPRRKGWWNRFGG